MQLKMSGGFMDIEGPLVQGTEILGVQNFK